MDEKKMCNILVKALNLEEEGRDFYIENEKVTEDENGKKMFRFLAEEEIRHYNKVAAIFKKYLHEGYCAWENQKEERGTTGIFEVDIPGAGKTGSSDALQALNVGIRAEENSIELYKSLANDAQEDEMRIAFSKLVDEEMGHKSMLEEEVEFITNNGHFNDFKRVTS